MSRSRKARSAPKTVIPILFGYPFYIPPPSGCSPLPGYDRVSDHPRRHPSIAALRHSGLTIVRADDHARMLGLLANRHRDLARTKNMVACRLHALLMDLVGGGCLASEMTVNKAALFLEQVQISDEVIRHGVVLATELLEDIVLS